MGDSILKFASVMSGGKWKPGGGKTGEADGNKIETRTFVRDISTELREELNPGGAVNGAVKDWWSDLLDHLPRCEIRVKVDAPAKTWAKIDQNMILENHFGQMTHDRVAAAIAPLASALLRILVTTDAKLPPLSDAPSPKALAAINQIWADCQVQCNEKIAEFQAKIGADVMEEIKKVFAGLKETKEEVQTYRFVAGARVFKGVVLIAGNIAHAAASWGATSPLAIVLIVRESIEIAQIVGKGLADVDDLASLVKFDLKAIQAAYTKDAADGKAQNNTVETLAGIASGVLAIEIPSVKNCKTHIGDFDHKVNLVKIDYVKLGAKLVKLQEKIKELDGKIATAKTIKDKLHKTKSNAEVIKGLEALSAQFGEVHKALFESVPEAKSIVEGYIADSAKWKATLAEYEKQTSGWTKHVSTLASIATEAGMGMGHIGGEHVETAAEVATQHLKLGMEAATIVMNALSDKALEVLSD